MDEGLNLMSATTRKLRVLNTFVHMITLSSNLYCPNIDDS